MTRTTAQLAATCAAAVALGLVACGGSTTPSGSASSPPASPTGEATSTSPAAVRKVSANTASKDEIAAALASAGVPNAERWADEVVEYRPYPTNDPNLYEAADQYRQVQPESGND